MDNSDLFSHPYVAEECAFSREDADKPIDYPIFSDQDSAEFRTSESPST